MIKKYCKDCGEMVETKPYNDLSFPPILICVNCSKILQF